MCGITGFIDVNKTLSSERWPAVISQMTAQLISRGPDDSGIWQDKAAGVAFGHRRLSVIDLSTTAAQPMESSNARYMVAYNGEIYNFRELRKELEDRGCVFRGHSDTEVLLVAVEEWGLEKAVKRFVGMFAFALWDKKQRLLHLVRDRLGEKPLYYGWMKGVFLFGSELKALRAHPMWQGEVNRDVLALYMRHNCVPAPYSIYEGIFKLLPGTILTIQRNGRLDKYPDPVPYWSAEEVARAGVSNLLDSSEEESINHLDFLLRNAVRGKMVADVPLGAFLSGGIDSSTVVALMQAQSGQPVRTFSIGFYEQGYNEAEQAKAVAHHLGTDHTELYVTPKECMDVIPKLPQLYDEPFADSSQIPTFLISEMTRHHVTVSLSGDGGDELFCGYNRYNWGPAIWKKVSSIPGVFRASAAMAIRSLTPQKWNYLFEHFNAVLPSKMRQRMPGYKLHKLSDILLARDLEDMYRGFVSHWVDPASVVLHASEPTTVISNAQRGVNFPELEQQMMYLDMISYLPDDILVKVDRASMGVGLEVRVPFLDHRVVEYAWKIPQSMKIRNGQGKWILRQVLYKYLPRELIERPKMGFGIPIDAWLRDPLREWAESLLTMDRLKREGFFDPEPIRKKWDEHLSGKRDWQYQLWDVLMFQAWLECQE